jgi:hypothetical protein
MKDQHKDLAKQHKNFHIQEMGEYHKQCDFVKELL